VGYHQVVTKSETTEWQKVCHDEFSLVFDKAHRGLGTFVDTELLTLGSNIRRAVDLPGKILDVAAVGMWAVHRGRGIERTLILPSERRLSRRFAVHCLDVETVDALIGRTFDLIADALAREIGHVGASELVEEAADRYVPTRREILRRVVAGPDRLRPLLSPVTLLTAPCLMGCASALLPESPLVRAPAWKRWSLTGALTALGAALCSTSAYHFLHLHEAYRRHVESIEDVLLFGSSAHDGEHHLGYGPGLLDVVAALERHRSTPARLASKSPGR
jgi:hypothetical protein